MTSTLVPAFSVMEMWVPSSSCRFLVVLWPAHSTCCCVHGWGLQTQVVMPVVKFLGEFLSSKTVCCWPTGRWRFPHWLVLVFPSHVCLNISLSYLDDLHDAAEVRRKKRSLALLIIIWLSNEMMFRTSKRWKLVRQMSHIVFYSCDASLFTLMGY